MKKVIFAISLIALVLGYGVYDYISKESNAKQAIKHQEDEGEVEIGIKVGQKAPEFELVDFDGRDVTLSEFQGRRVFLNFWGSWCLPCQVEMPHMQKYYEEFGDDVVILAVNVTSTEKTVKQVKDFVKDYGLTFPIALDGKGSVASQYQAFSLPTTYLLDENGVISQKYVGPLQYDTMKKAVSSLNK